MGAALDLFNVLFEPTAVFERVREKPRRPRLGARVAIREAKGDTIPRAPLESRRAVARSP
jgi:hypothetical protein